VKRPSARETSQKGGGKKTSKKGSQEAGCADKARLRILVVGKKKRFGKKKGGVSGNRRTGTKIQRGVSRLPACTVGGRVRQRKEKAERGGQKGHRREEERADHDRGGGGGARKKQQVFGYTGGGSGGATRKRQ